MPEAGLYNVEVLVEHLKYSLIAVITCSKHWMLK